MRQIVAPHQIVVGGHERDAAELRDAERGADPFGQVDGPGFGLGRILDVDVVQDDLAPGDGEGGRPAVVLVGQVAGHQGGDGEQDDQPEHGLLVELAVVDVLGVGGRLRVDPGGVGVGHGSAPP